MLVARQRLDQALLHNILGEMLVSQALSSKCHKSLEIPDDRTFDAGHAMKLASALSRANTFEESLSTVRQQSLRSNSRMRLMNPSRSPRCAELTMRFSLLFESLPEQGRRMGGKRI